MSDTPPEFDLKFLPDWLKAAPTENRYANYEGESRHSNRDDRRGPRGHDSRGPRPGSRPGGPGGPDRRGPRPGGPGGPRPGGPGGPRPGGPGGPGGQRREGPGGPRREGGGRPDDRRGPYNRDRDRPPQPQFTPANVRIEFLPEQTGAQSIAKQVKGSSRAYPLFSTGRLFLERPERHRVRITALDKDVLLYQIGDGPIAFDRSLVDRNAFRDMRAEYYVEETVQGEPLKGNFTNVARNRASGTFLGPTNHHGYQPALRKLYEERYSRRMSFQEFTQREIEVVTDEKSINDWKEQARSTTTFTTTKEAEPLTFKSVSEAENHFRKTYLPNLVKSGTTLECSGVASRSLPERPLSAALRDSWEKERGFPAQLVNNLRPYLLEAGLHFFKHRKRILYISAIKPLRIAPGQDMAGTLSAIIAAVEAQPKMTRRDLAAKILGANHEAPEMLEQKAQLARDLHYLVHAGHVIEFHDGTLDLPLPPGGQQQQQQGQGGKNQPKQGAAAAPQAAAADAVVEEADEAAESLPEEAETPAESQAPEEVAPAAELQAATPTEAAEAAVLTSSTPEGESLPEVSHEELPPSLHAAASEPVETIAEAAPLESAASTDEAAPAAEFTAEPTASADLAQTSPLVAEAPAVVSGSAELTAGEPAPAEAGAVTDSLQQ